MKVKPANPGHAIPDPLTRGLLPAEGGRVADTPYWRRRLAQGDVVLVPDPAGQVKDTPAAGEPTAD